MKVSEELTARKLLHLHQSRGCGDTCVSVVEHGELDRWAKEVKDMEIPVCEAKEHM